MNLFKRNSKEETVFPAGKLKGEINGEFEAFYLAVDKDGKFFKNYSLPFKGNPYAKANDWQEISTTELVKYLRHLSFVNKKQKSLHR